MKPRHWRALQRGSGWLLAVVVVLLVADSAFLATAYTPAGLVAPMQRLHLWLGGALTALLPPFVAAHWQLHRRHRNTDARRIGLLVAAVAAVGCVAGCVLWATVGGAGSRSILLLHEGAFVLAVATYVVHRLRARVTPALRAEWVGVGGIVVLVGGTWVAQLAVPRESAEAPLPAYAPGLSRATTRDGHVLRPEDLGDPAYCADCHPSIAARWESSAHRHSSLNNPFYAKTLAVGQAERDPDQMKFCGGCHDPLLLLTGRMDAHPQPGEPDTDAAITCLACHAIEAIPDRVGNGGYRIAPVEHYPGFGSDDADERALGARLIRTKPAQHIASLGPEHLRSPQMCQPCHKAHIPEALNGYRWLAGQNEFDPWHDSGAGGNSARTFFPPAPKQKRCQDCHMPQIASDDPAAKDGTVADHAFPGANTALPTAVGDAAWAARNAAFLQDVLTLDVGAVDVASEQATARWLAPEGTVHGTAGARTTLDVVVRNVGSGHLFPGGIADLREVWLEATLVDAEGTPQVATGWLQPDGVLDPDAHRWNAVLLDPDGNLVKVHDVERSAVVLSSRRIMLGASDVVRLQLPFPDAPATVRLRVLHRKFGRDYVAFVLGDDAPPMPITVMAEASIDLTPGDKSPTEPGPSTGARLRNLGIGHLLRGDTTLAKQAAAAAATRLPEDPGPPLDLARAALADGDLDVALEQVRAADVIQPGHPTAAWLLARVRAAEGNHPAALEALDVALEAFPRDRELLVMAANALFKLERDEEAAARLEQVLAIDPEHVSAHALLMRIRAEQGDDEAAARHEAAWNRVRPSSADRTITERARREHPALDRRANQQYVLPLATPPAGWAPAQP
ncbi:MAG: tetratricopeptide repeat protein [Myxococcota bacterium]